MRHVDSIGCSLSVCYRPLPVADLEGGGASWLRLFFGQRTD